MDFVSDLPIRFCPTMRAKSETMSSRERARMKGFLRPKLDVQESDHRPMGGTVRRAKKGAGKKTILEKPIGDKTHWSTAAIRALSPALAVKFSISPGRWMHFPLWPLFLLRDKGKWTGMTGTQHVGFLKHQFLHYIPIKMVLLFFITKIIFLFFAPLLFGSNIYRQQATTFSALA
jgi:hypothetical protein